MRRIEIHRSESVAPKYCLAMDDRPEEANGSYVYSGRTFRLDERDSEEWRVFDGGIWIGTVRAFSGVGTAVHDRHRG